MGYAAFGGNLTIRPCMAGDPLAACVRLFGI
jgi:hypothetical protein